MCCNSLLIKNAIVPGDSRDCLDILIRDGIIAEVAGFIPPEKYDCEVLDAHGKTVMPAFADMHTHLRTPGYTHKETLATGCAAAVAGGYTVINAMANVKPVCSEPAMAASIAAEARSLNLCDVYQCLSMTHNFDGRTTGHFASIDNLSPEQRDVVRCASDDGHGISNGRVFLEAVKKANKHGLLPLIHAEDADFTDSDMALAEDIETLRDVYLLHSQGLRAHFCHVSTAKSASEIINAKQGGAKVTMEVTPHHLALSESSTDYCVNPPLRPESDREFLIKAALDGYVDVIATDHAPHTLEDKAKGAPGLVGLETAFSVCYTVLCVENGMKLDRLQTMMSHNPRRLLGLPEIHVAPGYPAHLAIADLDMEHTINSAEFKSMGRNTPFHGKTYQGVVTTTIYNGKIVNLR